MRVTTRLLNSLKFNFHKHFIQNPNVKVHSMEALGHKGDQRFGYSETFRLLDDEAVNYIRNLAKNEDFVRKTKFVTSFSPFVLRNCAMHDTFLHDIYTSPQVKMIQWSLISGAQYQSTVIPHLVRRRTI